MKAGWTLLKLQLKKYGKTAPVILAESLLIAVIVAVFGIYAVRAIYKDGILQEIKVGIVSEEKDAMTGMLIEFVESMESFEGRCSFELLEENEAKKALSNHEVYAVVYLPEGMMEGILNGTNPKVRVVLSQSGSEMETAVFEEVAKAAGDLLSTAQAGIYAADDFCIETGQSEKIVQAEAELNQAYLDYALNRTAVFKMQEVSATGKVGSEFYYLGALLLAFLSFIGIVMGKYAQTKQTALSDMIAFTGINYAKQYGVEAIAFAFVFALLGSIIGVPLMLLCMEVTLGNVAALFLIFFSLGMFLRMLVEITGNEAGGMGVSIVLLFLMMLCGGLFLPTAFLPDWVERIGQYLPYGRFLTVVIALMQGLVAGEHVRVLLILTGVFWLMGAGVFYLRRALCIPKEKMYKIKAKKEWKPLTAILCKQYILRHRLWFVLLLIAGLFLLFWGGKEKEQNIQGIPVGIYAGDEMGEKLFEKLNEEEGIFRFTLFEEEEEMYREVKNGNLECAYVLPKDFFENITSGRMHRQIEMFCSPASTAHKLCNEVVFAKLFSMLSYEVLETWGRSGLLQEFGEEELARLMEMDEMRMQDGSTFHFSFEYVGSKREIKKESLDTVRGSIAVIVFLLALIGLGNCCEIREKAKFLPRYEATRIKEISMHISLIGAILSGVFLLLVSGHFCYESWWLEMGAVLVYFITLEVFIRFLGCFLKTARRVYAAVPMLLFGSVLFCPVFVQIKTYVPAMAFVEKIFPVTWYLQFFL